MRCVVEKSSTPIHMSSSNILLSISTPLRIAAATLVVSPLSAAILFQQDFNSYPVGESLFDATANDWFAYHGSLGSKLDSIVDSGVTGYAAELNSDSTADVANGWWFSGIGTGNIPAPSTSALSDLRVQVDLAGEGFSGTGDLNIVIEQSGGKQWGAFFSLDTANTWKSFDLTLDNFSQWSGHDSLDAENTITFVVQSANQSSSWGFDALNTMRIDNVMIKVIPEPNSLAALAGLTTLFFALRRRRK